MIIIEDILWGRRMEQEIRAFLNKFIASLCLKGKEVIPFAGEEFQQGIGAAEEYLKKHLSNEQYKMISSAFVKVPVEESYQQIRGMFMNMNGSGISFSGADNPMWTKMSIKMTPYLAARILQDDSVIDIDERDVNGAVDSFCNAAGVVGWEKF